jgi:transposase-like protein
MTTTSPISKLAQGTLPDELREPLEQLLAQGLGEISIRQLLGMTLSGLAAAERSAYLHSSPTDKGNGSYDRSVAIGSIAVPIEVPRTRSGMFRPSLLPAAYQRAYPDEMQQLLLALLCSSRSVNAAKAALRKLGLPCSEDDLDAVAGEYVEEFALRNSRPLDPDLIALFIDGKYVEVKDGDHIRPVTIYLAVGLMRSGHKRERGLLKTGALGTVLKR